LAGDGVGFKYVIWSIAKFELLFVFDAASEKLEVTGK
jgi:hypothetical protein